MVTEYQDHPNLQQLVGALKKQHGFTEAASFRFSYNWGKLLENQVHAELKRRGHDCYYWKGKKLEAMNEFGLDKGMILTREELGTVKTDGGTIEVMPVWWWLLAG